MADWLSTGAGLLGAYLGSKGNDTKTTSTNAIDPRMGSYIYGNGSNVQGVLPAATDWYQKNQSGLNDQSLQGLNRQWNTASDPNTAQGYTNMQGLGSSLMGGGVAGNPFSNGQASLGGHQGGNLGFGGQPAQPMAMAQPQFNNPATMGGATAGSTSGPFTQPTSTWHPQTQQAALANWAQGPNGFTGGYSGGGNGSNTPGTPGEGFGTEGFGGLMSSIGGFMSDHPQGMASIAGLLGGPLAGLGVQGLMSLLGSNNVTSGYGAPGYSNTGLSGNGSSGGSDGSGATNGNSQGGSKGGSDSGD